MGIKLCPYGNHAIFMISTNQD